MYLRTKTVKGRTYYQVVEGYRDVAKGKDGRPISVVRQRVLMSLGTCPTLPEALEARQDRLAQLEEERAQLLKRYPDRSRRPRTVARELFNLNHAIRLTRSDIKSLEGWIKSREVARNGRLLIRAPNP
jgi:hypothetical protein